MAVTNFDPSALVAMCDALEAAWKDVQAGQVAHGPSRALLAERILQAASNGEADRAVLKRAALTPAPLGAPNRPNAPDPSANGSAL